MQETQNTASRFARFFKAVGHFLTTNMRKKFFITVWTLLILGTIAVYVMFYVTEQGAMGDIPDLEQLEDPVDRYASQLVSADGQVLGTWSYSQNNRIYVDYEDLPQHLVDALVATEDERFYEHSGIDFRAFFRAAFKTGVMRQSEAGGGSTITQQLAKLLYHEREKAASTREVLKQKLGEWVIAVKLESIYTKKEILTLYLNKFDFLHNAVGIKMAAQTYFGKEPRDLSIEESAVLVGMCKNPSLYNPMRFNERSRSRRNVVLDQMVRSGYLTADSAAILKQLPLVTNYHAVDHKIGSGTYLRERLRQMLMAKRPYRENYASWQAQQFHDDSLAWATDPLYGWCYKHTKPDGSYYNLYQDGLIIHTTIDSRMQDMAEKALVNHLCDSLQPAFEREARYNRNWPYDNSLTADEIKRSLSRSMRQSERYAMMKRGGHSDSEINQAFNKPTAMKVFAPVKGDPHREVDTVMTPMDSIRYYKRFLMSGFVCMEASTGHVLAYVGGRDFAHFQYDMAGVGRRQVGSTIKPFLYSLAMMNEMSPCDEVPNVQTTYTLPDGNTWTPRNGSRARYGENVTLRWGLQQSNNWISAYLINRWRPNNFARLLRVYGIESLDLTPTLSLCLGTVDISPLEMCSAYTTFVNQGMRYTPVFVTSITDRNGEQIGEAFSTDVKQVLDSVASYKMLDLLRSVVDGGTGSRMRSRYGVHAPMGGKTGTTNNNSDGWFMCVTPQLVAACWVGGEERDIHFNSMAYGQGAAAALPITAKFLQGVYNNADLPYSPNVQFNVPEDFDPCRQDYDDLNSEGTAGSANYTEVDDVFN